MSLLCSIPLLSSLLAACAAPPPLAVGYVEGEFVLLAPIEVAESLLRSRQLLFDTRELRPRPQLDDKVLTAWNGLMIAAFARASRVLGGGALGQENIENPTAGHLQTAATAASNALPPARKICSAACEACGLRVETA